MRASKSLTTALALLLVSGVGATAFARSPREDVDSNNNHYISVMVTGSHIPQRVRIKRIGTLTEYPLRVFDRREIDQTGAFNTEDVLRHDPDLRVHGFGQAGPGN